jgi:hypothetical protein
MISSVKSVGNSKHAAARWATRVVWVAAYMTAETASGEECASNWPEDSTYLY